MIELKNERGQKGYLNDEAWTEEAQEEFRDDFNIQDENGSRLEVRYQTTRLVTFLKTYFALRAAAPLSCPMSYA